MAKALADDHETTHARVHLTPPWSHFPAIDDAPAIRPGQSIVLTADDMALERPLIHLTPARVEAGENIVLAAAEQTMHRPQTELLQPSPVGQKIMHLVVKHGHGDRCILHQHRHDAIYVVATRDAASQVAFSSRLRQRP